MRSLSEGLLPSRADIEAVLQFAPMLERRQADASFIWDGVTKEGETKVISMGYISYGRDIEAFVSTLYDHGFIQTFNWAQWQERAEEYFEQPELISKADLQTCVKLLTLHVRKDRFLDGHLGEMIASGHIARVLHRLNLLRDIVPPSHDGVRGE